MGNIAFGSLHSALVSFLSIALLMGMSPSRLSAQDDSSGDKSNTIELTESTPNVLLGFRLIEATKSLEILSQQRKRIVDVQSQPFHLSPVSEREATRIDELLDRVDGTNQAYEQLKARVEAYRNNMRQSSTRAAPIPPQPAPDKESAEGQPSPNPSLLDANNVSSNANQQESRALLLECKLLYSRLNAYQSALSKVERQLREEKFDLLGIEGRLDHASQTLNSLKSRDGISIESSVSYPSNAQMAWDTSRVPDYAYSPFGDGLNPYDYSTSSSSNSIGYGNLSSTADSTFYEIINELDRIEQLNTTIPQTQQRVAEQLSFLKSENESVGKRIAEVKTQAKEELARVDDQVKAVTAEKKSIEEALNNRDTTLNQFSINKLLIYAVYGMVFSIVALFVLLRWYPGGLTEAIVERRVFVEVLSMGFLLITVIILGSATLINGEGLAGLLGTIAGYIFARKTADLAESRASDRISPLKERYADANLELYQAQAEFERLKNLAGSTPTAEQRSALRTAQWRVDSARSKVNMLNEALQQQDAAVPNGPGGAPGQGAPVHPGGMPPMIPGGNAPYIPGGMTATNPGWSPSPSPTTPGAAPTTSPPTNAPTHQEGAAPYIPGGTPPTNPGGSPPANPGGNPTPGPPENRPDDQ